MTRYSRASILLSHVRAYVCMRYLIEGSWEEWIKWKGVESVVWFCCGPEPTAGRALLGFMFSIWCLMLKASGPQRAWSRASCIPSLYKAASMSVNLPPLWLKVLSAWCVKWWDYFVTVVQASLTLPAACTRTAGRLHQAHAGAWWCWRKGHCERCTY